MGRLGEAIDSESVTKGPPCMVAALLDEMDEEDRVDFLKRLADRSIACTIIQAKLAEFGYSIGVTSLRRHRVRMLARGGEACACQV